jgi:hypothetical protein
MRNGEPAVSDEKPEDPNTDLESLRRFYPDSSDEELKAMLVHIRAQHSALLRGGNATDA